MTALQTLLSELSKPEIKGGAGKSILQVRCCISSILGHFSWFALVPEGTGHIKLTSFFTT